MQLRRPHKKKPRKSVVSARYRVDRIRMIDKLARRWGDECDRSDVVIEALDRLLVSEGLLEQAA